MRSALPTLSTFLVDGGRSRAGLRDAWDSHSRLPLPLGEGGEGSVAEPRLPFRESEGDAALALPESMAAPGDHLYLLVGLLGGAGDGVGASDEAVGVRGGGGRALVMMGPPRAPFGAFVVAWGGFGLAGVSKSAAAGTGAGGADASACALAAAGDCIAAGWAAVVGAEPSGASACAAASARGSPPLSV